MEADHSNRLDKSLATEAAQLAKSIRNASWNSPEAVNIVSSEAGTTLLLPHEESVLFPYVRAGNRLLNYQELENSPVRPREITPQTSTSKETRTDASMSTTHAGQFVTVHTLMNFECKSIAAWITGTRLIYN